jgi:hypothetical protein
VLGKLCDAILHYAHQGRGVKLEDIINLWPKVGTKSRLSFGRRFDSALEKGLGEGFAGRIENIERRGWTGQDYRAAWSAGFPDDPIED